MGEIAEMTLNGLLCEGCGSYMDDHEEPGYPRRCDDCGGEDQVSKAVSINLRFCFRLKAEARMAEDQDGNPAECFSEVKIEGCKKSPADYDKMHEALRNGLASDLKINPDYVVPISPEEYDSDMIEDDDEFIED
jgi:hypothetical protein